MRNILFISALTVGLVGCSSDDPVPTADELTHLLLNGTWVSACDDSSGTASAQITTTFNNGDGTEQATLYSDLLCMSNPLVAPAVSFTYTFGNAVTVDGSVAGITDAQEIDMVFANSTQYTIFAIKDITTLYFGVRNNHTPATRPTQLVDFPYTVQ